MCEHGQRSKSAARELTPQQLLGDVSRTMLLQRPHGTGTPGCHTQLGVASVWKRWSGRKRSRKKYKDFGVDSSLNLEYKQIWDRWVLGERPLCKFLRAICPSDHLPSCTGAPWSGSERLRTPFTTLLKQDFWGQPCKGPASAPGTSSALAKVERDVTFSQNRNFFFSPLKSHGKNISWSLGHQK